MSQTEPLCARAELPNTHPLTAYLLQLISIKHSNLCVSADVHTSSALLKLAEEVGDSICVLKTHADIVDDFNEKTIKRLVEISRRKRFLLFEDRKFGDIGSTVQSQYTRGPLQISTWAHLTNAHIFPGPAIITALAAAAASTLSSFNRSVSTEIYAGTPRVSSDGDDSSDREAEVHDYIEHLGKSNSRRPEDDSGRKGSVVKATTTISQTVETATLSRSVSAGEGEEGDRMEALDALGEPPHSRGLLLLAEMSSEGNLMTGDYTRRCVQAAREHADFVAGYISQRSLNGMGDNFLSFTPGVSLPSEEEAEEEQKKGDGWGQQYRTPRTVVGKDGCDIIIVGRGILNAKNRGREAERYRKEAWRAYEERVTEKRKR